jgi:hypothetical protein
MLYLYAYSPSYSTWFRFGLTPTTRTATCIMCHYAVIVIVLILIGYLITITFLSFRKENRLSNETKGKKCANIWYYMTRVPQRECLTKANRRTKVVSKDLLWLAIGLPLLSLKRTATTAPEREERLRPLCTSITIPKIKCPDALSWRQMSSAAAPTARLFLAILCTTAAVS